MSRSAGAASNDSRRRNGKVEASAMALPNSSHVPARRATADQETSGRSGIPLGVTGGGEVLLVRSGGSPALEGLAAAERNDRPRPMCRKSTPSAERGRNNAST